MLGTVFTSLTLWGTVSYSHGSKPTSSPVEMPRPHFFAHHPLSFSALKGLGAWQEMPAGMAQHSLERGLILPGLAELACLFSAVSAPIWLNLQEPRGCFTICLLVGNWPFCSSNRVLEGVVAGGQPTEALLLGLCAAAGEETAELQSQQDKWSACICNSKCDLNTIAALLQTVSY